MHLRRMYKDSDFDIFRVKCVDCFALNALKFRLKCRLVVRHADVMASTLATLCLNLIKFCFVFISFIHRQSGLN